MRLTRPASAADDSRTSVFEHLNFCLFLLFSFLPRGASHPQVWFRELPSRGAGGRRPGDLTWIRL